MSNPASPASAAPVPSDGSSRALRAIIAAFVLICLVATAMFVVAVRNIRRSLGASDWVRHTQAIVLETGEILTLTHEAESAMRSVALRGGALERTTLQSAWRQLQEHFEVLGDLLRADAEASARLERIKGLLDRRQVLAQEVVAARAEADGKAVALLLAADVGSPEMEGIKRELAWLKERSRAELAQRDRENFRQAELTQWTVGGGLVLNVLLLGGAGWLIQRELAARRRRARELVLDNERLEAAVTARTAELVRANEKLLEENVEAAWALQSQEHQVKYNQTIIEALRQPLMVVTRALHVSRVNGAMLRLAGCAPEQLINRPLSDFLELDTEEAINPLIDAMQGGHDRTGEAGVWRPLQGAARGVAVSLFPIRDQDRVIGGVVIFDPPGTELRFPVAATRTSP